MPYYRSNLIVLWFTTFLAAASWTQVVPFLPLFLQELGVKENLSQWAGLVFSLQFAAGILMAPLWGAIADRHGRKLMTVRAGVCLGAIYLLTGSATQAWQVALFRFLNGALTGFIPGSMALVASNTPKHLAGRYVAYVQTASAAGSVVGPVIGGILAQLFGIRGALYTSGGVVLFATLLVLVVVQERNKAAAPARSTFVQDIKTALHNPSLVTVMGISFLAMAASISVQPILAIHLDTLAHAAIELPATALSGAVFALPGLAFVLTASTWVRAGERFGHRRVVNWALGGAAATGLVLALTHSYALFALLFFGQGVFLAALRPCASALISSEIDADFHGRAFGMQQSANTLAGMLGPLMAGFVSGTFGTGSVFFVVALVILAGALILRGYERAYGVGAVRRASPLSS